MMTGKKGGGGGLTRIRVKGELQDCQSLENENYMIWCCFRVFVHVLMLMSLNYLCECFLFFRFN